MTVEADRIVSPADVVSAGLCIGCGSCAAQSDDLDAKMVWDKYGQLKPAGGKWLHGRSMRFSRTCPFAPLAMDEDQLGAIRFPGAKHVDRKIGRFQSTYVGHCEENSFRAGGSSGGMVSWVAAELLKRRLVDGIVHVAAAADPHAENRFFRYRISRTENEVREGAKSRYYPIELSSVLSTIRSTPGRYAIVGIPCFIKAINLLRAEDEIFRDRIAFTLGLVCGHMKSARFIESFAWQMGVPFDAVTDVEYRVKDADRPANWYTAQLGLRDGNVRRKDWWHLVDGDWGSGFFQNSACDFCDDVVAETADISFGDAWIEPYFADGRGTNVIIVRSAPLDQILVQAAAVGRLSLRHVDAELVAETQAAGFRQRREGLAYRLGWKGAPLPLRKRVPMDNSRVRLRRRLVYRVRRGISVWSHRIFHIARQAHLPHLYLGFGRVALSTYQALTYSRGRLGRLCDLVFGTDAPARD